MQRVPFFLHHVCRSWFIICRTNRATETGEAVIKRHYKCMRDWWMDGGDQWYSVWALNFKSRCRRRCYVWRTNYFGIFHKCCIVLTTRINARGWVSHSFSLSNLANLTIWTLYLESKILSTGCQKSFEPTIARTQSEVRNLEPFLKYLKFATTQTHPCKPIKSAKNEGQLIARQ